MPISWVLLFAIKHVPKQMFHFKTPNSPSCCMLSVSNAIWWSECVRVHLQAWKLLLIEIVNDELVQSLHSKQEVLFNENLNGNNSQIMPTCFSYNQKLHLELLLLLTGSRVLCSLASLSSAYIHRNIIWLMSHPQNTAHCNEIMLGMW